MLYLCHTNKIPMNVQLKNIKTNLTFSEETIMFNADLYINNKKIGYCSNDGRGGNTNYYGNTKEDYQMLIRIKNHMERYIEINRGFANMRIQFDFNPMSVF